MLSSHLVVLGPVSDMTRSLNNEVLHICAQTLFAPVSSFDAVRAVGRLILATDWRRETDSSPSPARGLVS